MEDDDDPNYYVVTYFEEETDTTAWAAEIITSDHDVITTAEEVTTSKATIITHPDQKTTTAKSKLPSLPGQTAATTSYHHIVTFTSLTVLYQPAWSNPWRQQIRLAIDKVVQRSVSRRALESIWRQTMTTSRAAAVVSSPPSKDSGGNSSSSSKSSPSTSTSPASKLPAGVTSHLAFSPRTLFPFDRFWLVVVQWVAPLATVALLILCLILEPVSGELCELCFIRRVQKKRQQQKQQQQGKLSSKANNDPAFDTLYRGLSAIPPEKSSRSSSSSHGNGRADIQSCLFPSKTKKSSAEALSYSKGPPPNGRVKKSLDVVSWRSLDSWRAEELLMAKQSKQKKGKKAKDVFTFNSSAVFGSSGGKVADDPLRVKF
ncbi:hypothetical protein TYRP_010384 [Tyrophagus putrescentiae]|nr:hypothetical protein TYRP_010384 [Tyrophagus putrescentiae]